MDYSLYVSRRAGFEKVIFIIKHSIEDAFKEAIGDRIKKICKDLDVEIAYAYQELNELPEGVELPAGRTKPWGTGQAVLACKEVLHDCIAENLPPCPTDGAGNACCVFRASNTDATRS